MSGLLASMIAGGVKGYSEGRAQEVEHQRQFDMQQALQDAQLDKQLRLKELGYKMEQQHAADERARVSGLLQSGRDAVQPEADTPGGGEANAPKSYAQMSASEQLVFDASTLKNAGDLEGYDKMIARAKALAPEKGTLKDFDPSHIVMDGSGRIIYRGTGNTTTFKNDDDIWAVSQNPDDARYQLANRIIKAKSNEKIRVAAAGRAPERRTDDDEAYADWRKKPGNKDKGRDDWLQEKSRFGKDGTESVTTTTEMDEEGNVIGKKESRTSKGKAASNAPALKPWQRKF